MLPHLIIDFSDPSLLCWWPHRPHWLITEFVLVSGFLFSGLVTPTPGTHAGVLQPFAAPEINYQMHDWETGNCVPAYWLGFSDGNIDRYRHIMYFSFYLVFSILLAHFLCNTIMPLFINILNFQNDVYHFVTLLYKMTSHFAKMIIPGYFKTFYVAAATRAEQSFIRQFYIF